MSISATPAWRALATHADAVRNCHLRDLFAADPERFAATPSNPTASIRLFKQLVTADTIPCCPRSPMPQTYAAGRAACSPAKQ